jgi:hypothetical protein
LLTSCLCKLSMQLSVPLVCEWEPWLSGPYISDTSSNSMWICYPKHFVFIQNLAVYHCGLGDACWFTISCLSGTRKNLRVPSLIPPIHMISGNKNWVGWRATGRPCVELWGGLEHSCRRIHIKTWFSKQLTKNHKCLSSFPAEWGFRCAKK